MGSFVLKRAYKKASGRYPGFESTARSEISRLSIYERNNEKSLDQAADAFSHILSDVAAEDHPEQKRRPLFELLYHLGRWIYIIDACDDIIDDAGAERYNPVIARFAADGGRLTEDSIERLKTTLSHSNNLLGSAFELLPENYWSGIIRNIIYLGMPEICRGLFDHRESKPKNKHFSILHSFK